MKHNAASIFGILSGIILFALITNAFLNVGNEYCTKTSCKISEISANNIAINLFGNFLLSFEALSLLLTAAVIGAIILAFKEKEENKVNKVK
ncbi:MAG: hypothetical protein GW779_04800 [Candidatus Altiarchaeum hamiconexum]|uniref:NADH-quinone oxidoreductase subunit J n=1 Tax=Candidatus Altarchaeum hamiconexum TaxID=1803513 RepID=A0A8J7Z125_9ARCH|nr:hypothetical protein [Candidatus Altarchaeum hamiconexum]OIQ05552.1 MAG: hypothetical protein AUK59_03495 [Candidatus Altarchaeum sp. CG2_30_32_3053]PIN67740.1 MAG: hypothetical protein COV98_01695 [Candidatus Altarchaeum sp. CG12_big_fil_rev_8_21_14_0_65_33_22]PIV27232.1 MAG: hypothetical protein COS36_06550 [Candidatus Altarchaeum sp. CG03_land_8_20_14_0_80_32_618]PIX48470.1 MAG: hypothetical protein COZ53_03895 [Candidatus Altarchaeum sp. CG_4_8_14_3_um_filter_33_2054]PIZ31790.1 MAG: hyp